MGNKAIYFFPERTKNGDNYYTLKTLRSGKCIKVQLPCEGIYTAFEMEGLHTTIPGEWRTVPRSQVGYVFGLRQFFGND